MDVSCTADDISFRDEVRLPEASLDPLRTEDEQRLEQPAQAERDIVALKAIVGRCGRLIGGEAIQMHGGMDVTGELVVGHGMKRLMVINTSFSDADHQRQTFAALATA